MTLDPESGATLPDNTTSPFPNPIDSAMDYTEEARGHMIQQYRDKARAIATTEALVANTQLMEAQLARISLLDDPNAVQPYTVADKDVNLDVTGELVGQDRVLINGTVLEDGLRVGEMGGPTAYRALIAQRILRNHSIGSGPEFVAALEYVFGATPFRFLDLGHMSVRLEIGTAGPPTDDQIAILDSDVMPRAMGVGINRVWYDPANYFGFSDDPNADGFGEIGDPPPPGGKFAELF